jgi:hypothetical protein
MTPTKKLLSGLALAASLGAGGMAITAGPAAAYVACNAAGDCWHTDKRYRYAPAYAVRRHPDSWYFHRDWDKDKTLRWRSHHDGRGYYRDGVWITF